MTSSSMPYVKLYTEILDDHKMRHLSPAAKWHFVALILLAGKCDAEGYLVNGQDAMTVEDIAWDLRDDVDSLQESVDALVEVGMLIHDDGIWLVSNFSKRQGRPQYEKRKAWRDRKRKQRAQEQEDTTENHEDVSRESRVTPASVQLAEKEKEKEESKRKSKSKRKSNAGKPASPSSSATARASPGGKFTTGQRGFLDLFGAKRYKNNVQKDTILELEKKYGTESLLAAGTWAAKKGMSVSDAVGAVETALPKWGNAGNGSKVIKIGA